MIWKVFGPNHGDGQCLSLVRLGKQMTSIDHRSRQMQFKCSYRLSGVHASLLWTFFDNPILS
jgi:hypothetical protein